MLAAWPRSGHFKENRRHEIISNFGVVQIDEIISNLGRARLRSRRRVRHGKNARRHVVAGDKDRAGEKAWGEVMAAVVSALPLPEAPRRLRKRPRADVPPASSPAPPAPPAACPCRLLSPTPPLSQRGRAPGSRPPSPQIRTVTGLRG